MSYTPTTWVEGTTKLGPTNLNHLELGVQTTATVADAATVTANAARTTAQSVKITTSTMAGGPPGTPADTDIWIATAVDALGTRWQFQYNAGSGSASKWEFVGGSPVFFVGGLAGSLSPGVWTNLTSIVMARAGTYTVRGGFRYAIGATAAHNVFAGVAAGAPSATTVSAEATPGASVAGFGYQLAVEDRITTTAGQAIILSGQSNSTSGGTDTVDSGWLSITPTRVA